MKKVRLFEQFTANKNVNEAVAKNTKVYQIATPAPKAMLVGELEDLFGDDYRHIVTEFDDNEGYESVLVFNLTKNDIKRIQEEIGDVLIWEYSIKKGKAISESLVNEAFIGPFVFNDRMSDDELKAMYDGALDGYAYYAKGMQYPKSDYKKAYQEIEKILKKRGVNLNEAKLSTIHKAAKKGSYPVSIVVVQDGKVIHQESVSTPAVAPATFNVMQEKYPKALIHLEDKTGKRLFSESLVIEKLSLSEIKKIIKTKEYKEVAQALQDVQEVSDIWNMLDPKMFEFTEDEFEDIFNEWWNDQSYDSLREFSTGGSTEDAISLYKHLLPYLVESVVNEGKGAKLYFDDLKYNYQKSLRYLDKDEKKEYNKLAKDFFSKLAESVVNEGESEMIKQIERAIKDDESIFKLPMKTQDFYRKNKDMFESEVTESIFSFKTDNIEQLHFETDPKTAELMKIEIGKSQGEVSKRKQIESAEYSLRRFRKSINFGDGTYLGVFIPGSYDAATSTLGDGPHKKAVKKVRWTQNKYDQWLEDMASNGGAENAFDMAQNAKFEPGLIDWVKKEFRGDDPLQRIQWDIEGAL